MLLIEIAICWILTIGWKENQISIYFWAKLKASNLINVCDISTEGWWTNQKHLIKDEDQWASITFHDGYWFQQVYIPILKSFCNSSFESLLTKR